MGINKLEEVYVLHHVREYENGGEDVKLLGIFSSERKAEEEIKHYKRLEGFKKHPEGFSIDKYILNKTEWEEGFITLDH